MLLKARPGPTRQGGRRSSKSGIEGSSKGLCPLLEHWQPRLGVQVERWFIRRMKTRWGSCNHKSRTIRLNTELAKKPTECLDYIFVHEMVHLPEPTHNARFLALMDQFMPKWQIHRQVLNRLPVRQEKWSY